MSTTIIGYNDEKMKELGLPTDTWAVIFDPKHLEKVKGRVTVLDSANELFAAALKYLGYSANDVDPKHWDEAAAVDQEGEAVLGRVQRVVVHQGADRRQHLAGARLLERHLPGQPRRAGGRAASSGSCRACRRKARCSRVDNMVIHKSAPRPDLALKFINFMLEGKNSAELTNLIGSGNPNTAAMQVHQARAPQVPGDLSRQGGRRPSSSS